MLPFLDAESFSTTAVGTAVVVVLLALLMMVKVCVVSAALAQGVGREKLAFPPSHPHTIIILSLLTLVLHFQLDQTRPQGPGAHARGSPRRGPAPATQVQAP